MTYEAGSQVVGVLVASHRQVVGQLDGVITLLLGVLEEQLGHARTVHVVLGKVSSLQVQQHQRQRHSKT